MSTAKLAVWLHWQVTWVRFRASSSQPLADQPPGPPGLQRKGGVGPGPSAAGLPEASCPRWSQYACRTLTAPTSAPVTLGPQPPSLGPCDHAPPSTLRGLMSARGSRCVIAVKLKWTAPHAPCVGNISGLLKGPLCSPACSFF